MTASEIVVTLQSIRSHCRFWSVCNSLSPLHALSVLMGCCQLQQVYHSSVLVFLPSLLHVESGDRRHWVIPDKKERRVSIDLVVTEFLTVFCPFTNNLLFFSETFSFFVMDGADT